MATKKLYEPLDSYTVAQMDNWIKNHWQYFNNSTGYSNCTSSTKYKFSASNVNTLHNCVGWAWGRWYQMQGITSKSDFKRQTGNPYELYQAVKKGSTAFKHGGVSQTPKVGAMIIWGKASASDGSSRSHIGIVEAVSSSYIWVSEDNYSTVRNYGGTRSRNGIRKIARSNMDMSTSYPLVGFILPIYDYILWYQLKAKYNVNMRKSSSTTAQVITKVKKGEVVKYCGWQQNHDNQKWYYVNLNGTEGWVCGVNNGDDYWDVIG